MASSVKLIYIAHDASTHDLEGHPERRARIDATLARLRDERLTERTRTNGDVERMETFASATHEDLKHVHEKNYSRSIEMLARSRAPLMLDSAPTYLCPGSCEEAMKGVGAARALVDRVSDEARGSKRAPTGFGLIRPPGHHATKRGGQGFCLFNTAVAAVCRARERGYERVLVYDFDVHHGNGTNDIFHADPNVLFVSTHEDGSYPGTGKITDVGEGDGVGATINIPLPPGSGDFAVLSAVENILMPAAARFKPDFIIISAGYDAHWRDPLAGLNFRTGTYHRLCTKLKEMADALCGGRIVFLLEGGYDLVGLSEGVADSFRALLSEGSTDIGVIPGLRDEPMDKVRKVLAEVKALHQV